MGEGPVARNSSPRPALRYSVIVAFALWLMLRQVDGVLARLQSERLGGYGANDLGPLNPRDLPTRVDELLDVWNATPTLAHTAFGVYSGLDALFIVAYVVLIWKLSKWLPDASAARTCAIVAAIADVLEDALRAVMVWVDSSAWVVYLAWTATIVKWLAVLCAVFVIMNRWRVTALATGPGELSADRLHAMWRLRWPAVLLLAWGLFLIFDPTGQAPDTFRRWLDSLGRFAGSAALTLAAATLLGVVTWTTTRRAILAHFSVTDWRTRRWLPWVALIFVLAVTAWKPGWRNVLGLAITIAIVFALSGLARILDLGSDARAESASRRLDKLAAAPELEPRRAVQRVARGLAVWPLIALLFALASAWTAPPVVLFSIGEDECRAWVATVGSIAAVVAAMFVARLGPLGLAKADGDAAPGQRKRVRILCASIVWPYGLEIRHVIAAGICLTMCGVAIAWPLDVPPFVGVVAIAAFAFAVFIGLLGEGQRYGETHAPPRGLRMLGFPGLPTVGVLVVAFVIASIFNDGTYHAVARNGGATPSQDGVPLQEAFDEWVARNCADDGSGTMPMVFVASQGGGIRAAYWTTSVMTTLFGKPPTSAGDSHCPGATRFGRVFAVGGASGGSLGVTSYSEQGAAHDADTPWWRAAWGDTDFASVPVSWGLLVDLPRNFVGFDAPDRARRLEEIWERQDPSLAEDFFASQPTRAPKQITPLVVLTSTQVESGCRMNVSALRLTTPPSSELPGECGALLDRGVVDRSGKTLLPGSALTSDLVDYLCDGGSLNRSSAALMSARFPYVTPSGQLDRCASDRTTAVADGGYAENTGGQMLLAVWARVEPLVEAHNAAGKGAQIVPVFIDVDNHYAKAAKAGTVGRTEELVVPPKTKARPDKLDDRGVEQTANATFSLELPGLPERTCQIGRASTQRFVHIAPPQSPGIPAPLAWTMSDMAMDDLDRQRAKAFKAGTPAANLRLVLKSGKPACSIPVEGPIVDVSRLRPVPSRRRVFEFSVHSPHEWARVMLRFYTHAAGKPRHRFRFVRRTIAAGHRIRIRVHVPAAPGYVAATAEHGNRSSSFRIKLPVAGAGRLAP